MKKTIAVQGEGEVVLDMRIATARDGIVFCPKCGAIREVSGPIPITNQCREDGTDWATLDDIDPDKFGADVTWHRNKVKENLARWKLEIQPNVDIAFYIANSLPSGSARNAAIMRATMKAETHYYKKWADNQIAEKKKPMSEEAKERLRKLNRPDPVNIEPLMKVTIKQILKETDIHAIRKLYFDVYGADAGASLTAERMKTSMVEAIRELIESKKRQPDADDPGPEAKPEPVTNQCSRCKHPLDPDGVCRRSHANPTKSGGVGPATPKAAKSKTPIYEDKKAQEEREGKYPWIIKGTWRADPEHEGGTILDIKCEFCGNARTIHAADAFQVKSHVECKKKSKSK